MTTREPHQLDRPHSTGPNTLKLGIVDNDPLVLEMLDRNLRVSGAPIVIAWTTTDAATAITRCATSTSRPDLILTDMQMPEVDGPTLARRIRAAFPGIRVVGITAFPIPQAQSPASPQSQAQASATDPLAAVLSKTTTTDDLIAALAQISGNAQLLEWLSQQETARRLSEQETEIMRRYAQGDTNDAIAHELHLGVTTVKTYARRAFDKLGVHSRAEAVIMCLRRGWI